MDNSRESQSFNVDDIRRVREEADKRYQGMTPEEISRDIHERAQVGYRIIERLRQQKAVQQVV